MNHFAVTYINAHVGNVHVVTGEKYQVAGLQVLFVHRVTGCGLNIGCARQADTLLGIYILHETGAVKTVGRGTSPNIGHTQELLGQIYNAALTGQIRFMGTYRHGAVEQGLIRCAADNAVNIQMIVILEFSYSCLGSRAVITIHGNIITAASQSLLNLYDFSSCITEMKAGCLGKGN